MLLMSSTKLSVTICVSVKRNTVGVPSIPVWWYSVLRSSRNSFTPYPRVSSMLKHLKPAMKEAKRVRLCFPEPPTPTSIALPRGWRRMRAILVACSAASLKKTRFMVLVEEKLYSSR